MEKDQIGLACWGMRLMSQEQQLALCHQMGVSRMELGIANGQTDLPENTTAERAIQVKSMFAEGGVALTSAATGCDFTRPEPAAVQSDVQKVKHVILLCQMLDIRYLRIFAGFSPAEEVDDVRFDRMAEALQQLACYARESGVRLAIETHGGVISCTQGVRHIHSVSTRMDCLKKLLSVLPEDVDFVLDPANLDAVGVQSPAEYYRLLRGRIAYLHAKDFVRLPAGWLRPSACGTGGVDWKDFFRQAADYTGPVLIEYEQTEDVAQGMQASVNYLKTLCTK